MTSDPVKLSFKGDASFGRGAQGGRHARSRRAVGAQSRRLGGQAADRARHRLRPAQDRRQGERRRPAIRLQPRRSCRSTRSPRPATSATTAARRRPMSAPSSTPGCSTSIPYLPPEAPAAKPAPARRARPRQWRRGSSGWSDAPIDLSGLRAVDADMDLKLAGLPGAQDQGRQVGGEGRAQGRQAHHRADRDGALQRQRQGEADGRRRRARARGDGDVRPRRAAGPSGAARRDRHGPHRGHRRDISRDQRRPLQRAMVSALDGKGKMRSPTARSAASTSPRWCAT